MRVYRGAMHQELGARSLELAAGRLERRGARLFASDTVKLELTEAGAPDWNTQPIVRTIENINRVDATPAGQMLKSIVVQVGGDKASAVEELSDLAMRLKASLPDTLSFAYRFVDSTEWLKQFNAPSQLG